MWGGGSELIFKVMKKIQSHFSEEERKQMLDLKWVGETVIERLEQIGFSSLSQLIWVDPKSLTKEISEMIGSTCWHNSPQARWAITNIINLAEEISFTN